MSPTLARAANVLAIVAAGGIAVAVSWPGFAGGHGACGCPEGGHTTVASDAGAAVAQTLTGGSPTVDGGAPAPTPVPSAAADDDRPEEAPGGAVPALGKAPKNVRCGVILVTFTGAQGAPDNARSHDAARRLALDLSVEAKTNFKAAVAKGDPGSVEDLGRIPRGVLEPAAEYAVFTLPKGEVSEPVETPRGYWIVRRID